MADAPDRASYDAKYKANTKIEGYGLDVATVAPCPGCAEPDWSRWPIADLENAMSKSATCKGCGRSFRGLYVRQGAGVSVEFVQTGGDDLPAYLPPMRREPT